MAKTLSEFYTGKCILITGAGGYLGSFLLEVLLRCFPGIVRIYILLRPKKGLDPKARKGEIFKKRIFHSISTDSQELLEKVHVIEGDAAKHNLGISEENRRTLCEEVNIVFHSAATLNFSLPYRQISLQNAKGIEYLIDLCKRIKNLEILVYTSTIAANVHMPPENIEEKIYPLPYKCQRFLDEMEKGTDESFAALISSLRTIWNMKWPNSYCFSKCLAENILLEKAADLPIAIVRPSIVCEACKGKSAGYFEDGSVFSGLSAAIARGYLKVMRCDKDVTLDVIPVDLAVNCHIATAWLVATGRRPSPFVVHCSSGEVLKVKCGLYFNGITHLAKQHPVPNTLQETSDLIYVKNKLLYSILAFCMHYIPARVLDLQGNIRFNLSYNGRKLKMVEIYKLLDACQGYADFFFFTELQFQANNFYNISRELQPEEREIVYTDFGGLTSKELLQTLPGGADFYIWDQDEHSPEKRQVLVQKYTRIINFTKGCILLLILLASYFTISKVLF